MNRKKPMNLARTSDFANCLVIRRGSVKKRPSRRPGLRESRLLSENQSDYQNIVEVDVDEGAVVEYHQVATSESIYVLHGKFEVILSATEDRGDLLDTGDLVHFAPGSCHGLRCVKGQGRLLVIFAPPVSQKGGPHDA